MTKGPAAKATGPFLFMNGVCRSKVGLVNPGALVYNIMYCQNVRMIWNE